MCWKLEIRRFRRRPNKTHVAVSYTHLDVYKRQAEEQAKYLAFKEARRGAADYINMEGEFKKYLDDVYSEPPIPREALTDELSLIHI